MTSCALFGFFNIWTLNHAPSVLTRTSPGSAKSVDHPSGTTSEIESDTGTVFPFDGVGGVGVFGVVEGVVDGGTVTGGRGPGTDVGGFGGVGVGPLFGLIVGPVLIGCTVGFVSCFVRFTSPSTPPSTKTPDAA